MYSRINELVQLSRTFIVNIREKLKHFCLNTHSDFLDWKNLEEGCIIFHSTEAKILVLKIGVLKDRHN